MALKNFRAVTAGQSLSDAAIVEFNWMGNSLRPLAPVNLRGIRNAAGDLLIEWTRRGRLFGGLRDEVDTPLSEETEFYWVTVMSGSTVIREYRTEIAGAQPILWQVYSDPQARLTISNDGTIVAAPASNVVNGDAVAISQQTLGGPGDGMIEYATSLVSLPTQFGFARNPLADPSAPYDSDNSPFMWALNSFNGRDSFPNSAWYDFSLPGYTSHSGSTYDIDDNDTLAIERAGQRFNFYVNYQGPGSVPVFTSRHFMTDDFLPFVYFSANDTVTTKKALRCRIRRQRRSFLYPAAQQTIDFGSVQSSIKIRVAQESAIVGRGAYAEALL